MIKEEYLKKKYLFKYNASGKTFTVLIICNLKVTVNNMYGKFESVR